MQKKNKQNTEIFQFFRKHKDKYQNTSYADRVANDPLWRRVLNIDIVIALLPISDTSLSNTRLFGRHKTPECHSASRFVLEAYVDMVMKQRYWLPTVVPLLQACVSPISPVW